MQCIQGGILKVEDYACKRRLPGQSLVCLLKSYQCLWNAVFGNREGQSTHCLCSLLAILPQSGMHDITLELLQTWTLAMKCLSIPRVVMSWELHCRTRSHCNLTYNACKTTTTSPLGLIHLYCLENLQQAVCVLILREASSQKQQAQT